MDKIEIMFDDLNEEMKKKILDFYGIKSTKDMNWDIIPLIVLEK